MHLEEFNNSINAKIEESDINNAINFQKNTNKQ
jgi:hypothetical protein